MGRCHSATLFTSSDAELPPRRGRGSKIEHTSRSRYGLTVGYGVPVEPSPKGQEWY